MDVVRVCVAHVRACFSVRILGNDPRNRKFHTPGSPWKWGPFRGPCVPDRVTVSSVARRRAGPVRLALGSKSLRPPADRAPDGTQQPAWVVVVGAGERSAVTTRPRTNGGRVGPDEAARGTRAFGFIFALRFAVGFSRTTGRSRRSEHRTSRVSDGVRASHTPRRVHTSQCAAGSVTSPFPRGGAEAARRSTLSLPAPPRFSVHGSTVRVTSSPRPAISHHPLLQLRNHHRCC